MGGFKYNAYYNNIINEIAHPRSVSVIHFLVASCVKNSSEGAEKNGSDFLFCGLVSSVWQWDLLPCVTDQRQKSCLNSFSITTFLSPISSPLLINRRKIWTMEN